MSVPLLSVQELVLRFGGLTALNRVSFEVQPAQITALIGPNGAGKTTVFNCITGFYLAESGQMTLRYAQQSLDLMALLRRSRFFGGSHHMANAGIARTFQNIRLFKEMTVLENLLVAQFAHLQRHLLFGLWPTAAYRQTEAAAIHQATEWLTTFGLLKEANRLAGELSYGNQRRLEIARALCLAPRLLCLDEPAAGLNPRETESLRELIRHLQQQHHLTILLIEHDMKLVMSLSDYVIVLNHGEVIAQGSPQQVRQDPVVIHAYLGTGR